MSQILPIGNTSGEFWGLENIYEMRDTMKDKEDFVAELYMYRRPFTNIYISIRAVSVPIQAHDILMSTYMNNFHLLNCKGYLKA